MNNSIVVYVIAVFERTSHFQGVHCMFFTFNVQSHVGNLYHAVREQGTRLNILFPEVNQNENNIQLGTDCFLTIYDFNNMPLLAPFLPLCMLYHIMFPNATPVVFVTVRNSRRSYRNVTYL